MKNLVLLLLLVPGVGLAQSKWETTCAYPVFENFISEVGIDNPEAVSEILADPGDFRVKNVSLEDLFMLGRHASDFLAWVKEKGYPAPFMAPRSIDGTAPEFCKGMQKKLHLTAVTGTMVAKRNKIVPGWYEVDDSKVFVDLEDNIDWIRDTGISVVVPHELFHGIQNNYGTGYSTQAPGWITEGMADAMALEWLHERKPTRVTAEFGRIFGLRDYAFPLHEPRKAFGDIEKYMSSSFWVYLIRKHGDGLLQTFLKDSRREVCMDKEDDSMCAMLELDMLDEALAGLNTTHAGLAFSYPDFMSWHLNRLRENQSLLEREGRSEQYVIERTLGACVEVPLATEEGGLKNGASIYVGPIASSCLEVDIPGSGKVDLTLHTDWNEGMYGLAMGTIDGAHWSKPVAAQPQTGLDFSPALGVQWKFTVEAGGRVRFYLSNVALKASSTKEIRIPVYATLNRFETSLKNQADPKTGETTPAPGADEEADTGADGLTAASELSAGVLSLADEPACGDAFEFRACGPNTSINLMLVPESVAFRSSGAKGATSQNPMERVELAGQQDVSEVRITIPLIDYGFRGTFSNASLSVTAAGNRYLEAIGPADAIPGQGRAFPLSGQVTIDAYTPWMMRGSFSAELVEPEKSNLQGWDDSHPVVASISGRFIISSPWHNDRRIRAVNAAMPEFWQDGPAPATSGPATGDYSAITQMPISGQKRGSCMCSCNDFVDSGGRECGVGCGNLAAACEGLPASGPEQVEIQDDMSEAAMRARLAEILEELSPGPELQPVKNAMMLRFDHAGSIENKRAILAEYEAKLKNL